MSTRSAPAVRILWGTLFAAFAATVWGPSTAWARQDRLEPPGPREFILDTANLLDEETEARIHERTDKLLTDTATPIVVVTVPSVDEAGGSGSGGVAVDRFARELFNRWGVGQAEINGQEWNTGILLLVSPGDRAARIELGAGWGYREDATAQRIMDEYLVPNFRRERYAEGIEQGVEALDAMARKLELPAQPTPWWVWALAAAAAGLGVFTALSLIRSGSSGWAWALWAVVFAGIGWFLYQAATNSSSSSGGGFSGGSFGGGFSGGGGASGSW
ncbi:TPM domain-containing protein [Alienimonas californiensis]|uniref:TPM domain-containing protein n=1 Tax=Alienimonas californiensis TaxID=2527989 RepID=A0A517P985_9PLAN|nr:TPM domain-containing protein [Alienimonas californiensis]QDT15915.1 hypothetical protein CA12_20130 [Alienimonas californiensis]